MEEIKRFRQLHSMTPGHTGTGRDARAWKRPHGPLGQGLSNAVGMALAEKLLAAEFNRPGHDIVDHRTYVMVGDGCLMEGISHEACSLAGTLGLGKLIAFYDDNGISIDGHVTGWFTDDTPKRFEAYGWHVVPHVDGHDADAVNLAIEASKKIGDRPSLICCKTVIGKGSPNKAGSPRESRLGARRKRSRGDAQEHRLELSTIRNSRRRLRRVGCARPGRAAGRRLECPVCLLCAGVSSASGGAFAPHVGRTAARLAPTCRGLSGQGQ
jgi:transketolase